jgi:hypothetical protein|tara:strand:+ start:277 stop:501 length:225 start_codon:yes stop_codon:yes gene_type:complete
MNYKNEINLTAMDDLIDCYARMLDHFQGLGNMHCALELLAEHGHEMSAIQLHALKSFIQFHDALDELERARAGA